MRNNGSPSVRVDGILEEYNKILLVKRKKDPFKGSWSLTGGKVDVGETVEDALKREIFEETGIIAMPTEILGVYSDPTRDPRGHAISVTFVAKVTGGKVKEGNDTRLVQWFPIYDNIILAFDHDNILENYREWRRSNGTYWSSKQLRSTLI
jgi:8-oxo-dGTP diphosphatase